MKTFRLLAITTLATITITAAWGNAEILPKICESGKNANFTIEVTNYNGPMQDLRILYISQDGKFLDGKYHHDRKAFEVLTPECTSGSKTLKLNNIKLNGEGIHTMQLAIKANTKPVEWKVIGKIPVYSLQPDLFALRPYKGDFHAHSKNSDGAGPGFSVFAYARRGGHDFMTLSDHRKYNTAIPEMEKVNELNSGMLTIPGEEFHHGPTPLHSVSVNAKAGVCDWVENNKEEFDKMLEAKMKEVPQNELSEFDHKSVATAEVMYDIAREKAGAQLVIYSHPYWMPNGRYNAPTPYNKTLLDRHKFDAIECPNGTDVEQAMKVVADVKRLALAGYDATVVNVSDTHNAEKEDFASNHTIVFAKNLNATDICKAVRDGMCVATIGKVNDKPKTKPLYIGKERLIPYSYFLSKYYFPKHDQICNKQAKAMLKDLFGQGNAQTKTEQHDLRDQLTEYNKTIWAK